MRTFVAFACLSVFTAGCSDPPLSPSPQADVTAETSQPDGGETDGVSTPDAKPDGSEPDAVVTPDAPAPDVIADTTGDLGTSDEGGDGVQIDAPEPDADPGDADASTSDAESDAGPDIPVGDGGGGDAITGCPPAEVEIVAVDIWAQYISDATVDAGSATGTGALVVDLCDPETLSVTVSSDGYWDWTANLAYAGGATLDGLSVTLTMPDASHGGYYATTEIIDDGGVATRRYTVYTGFAHRYFASTGAPARRGTDVSFMINGEQAWSTVRAEMLSAGESVFGSSWWWDSEFELVRDPATHINLTDNERWANTIMGTLENLSGIDIKIMVGQFLSQDGIVDWFNIDSEITDKAEATGDNFEFMGQANPTDGEFVVTPPAVDFAARLEGAYPETVNAGPLGSAGLPAYAGPINVDSSDLPLGVSLLDINIASWHQKFWMIDQSVAFVGGMNATINDWDTSDHTVFEYRRMEYGASESARQAVADWESLPDLVARRDYMVRLEGEIVADVVDVFDWRWEWLLNEGVDYSQNSSSIILDPVPAPVPDGVQAQLISTMPEPFAQYSIMESLLNAISQAENFIYIEDQYFRAPILADAIIARMAEAPDLVVIAVTNTINEWVDPGCWQTYLQHEKFLNAYPDRYRVYQMRNFEYLDVGCTICFDETESRFENVSIHSKLVIIDDVYLEIGSCNHNNRGLLYEGELAVAVYDSDWVTAQRQAVFDNLFRGTWTSGTAYSSWIATFDAAANENQSAYDAWDDEGFDLNLNGDPLPAQYMPGPTFLYPIDFDVPDECLIEGVGADVT